MAISLAELIILSLLVEWGFRKIKIPGLVGMLIVGVITGPYVLQIMKPELSTISADLRMIALIVILLRAGFELSKETLQKVGMRAILLSCIPAILEGGAIVWLGHVLLHLSYMESAILGSVLAAVSPAVVVPLMIRFIEQKKGTDKGIPTLVLAASSIDDVFVIVVYTVLIGMYTGQRVNIAWKIAGIPISILLGIGAGAACGFGLYYLFERFNPRATKRILIILGVSIFFVNVEHVLENILPFAALLSVMAIGTVILEKSEHMAHEISAKLTRVWVFAEILLFTLVGAQVNLHVAINAGLVGILLIGLALVARSIGTYLCLIGSHLTLPERWFVVISYLPKATVQAAIGGAPLLAMRLAGMDTQPGEIILAIAVLSILVTAPVGAWAITYVGERVLETAQSERKLREKGKQLTRDDVIATLRTADVMHRDIILIRADEKVRQVVEYFAGNDFVLYPVIDVSNVLIGVIRLDNLQHLLASRETWEWLVAKDVATPLPHPIFSTSPLSEALTIMQVARLEQVPVIEKDSRKVIGLLDAHHAEKLIEQKLIEENLAGIPDSG